MLTVNFKDKTELYTAYMPFIKNGGIFVATDKMFKLGEDVTVHLQMMDEVESFQFTGKVVWITPKRAQGNRPAGIGIQFNEQESKELRGKIETYIAGISHDTRRTDTM